MHDKLDLQLPPELLKIQTWFGQMISKPLNAEGKISASSKTIKTIAEHIAPGKVLSSERRLEIYNQQYWYRFLSALQEVYPALCRLFSYEFFNKTLAIPYLKKHPPLHFALGKIGEKLPHWIKAHYQKNDKALVQGIAEIDWTYWELFYTPKFPPLHFKPEEISKVLRAPLSLQPHLRLFDFPFDLFTFRKKLLEHDVSYWIQADFPRLNQKKKRYYFLMFRNPFGEICWEELQEGESRLLKAVKEGGTLEGACLQLEALGGTLYIQASKQLPHWIKKWIIREYLTAGL